MKKLQNSKSTQEIATYSYCGETHLVLLGKTFFMSQRHHYFSYCIALTPTHSCTGIWVWECRNVHHCGKFLLFTRNGQKGEGQNLMQLRSTKKIGGKRFLEESDAECLPCSRLCLRALSTLMCYFILCSMETLHTKKVKHYAAFNKFCVSEVTFLCWKKPSNNGNQLIPLY